MVPRAPMSDFLEIEIAASSGHLRHLPLSIAVWQAITSYARHNHTDYDVLLADGYDQDSARHFIVDDLNATLELWGCSRKVDIHEA